MSYRPRVIHELAAEGVQLPEDVSRITHTMPQSTYNGGGASAGVLEDGRAVVMIVLSEAAADALAAARIARAGSDLLADDAKPVAHLAADSLIAAGYGVP
jgi:hypothetical protein